MSLPGHIQLSGTNIGWRSLQVLDLYNDGNKEMILAAQTGDWGDEGGFWYIMKYNPQTSNYDKTWTSESYPNIITRLKAFDINHDGNYKVFACFDNGRVIEFDGKTQAVLKDFNVPVNETLNDIEFGDADNDKQEEIAISTNDSIFLYDKVNLNLKSIIPYGAFDFKIGKVDKDRTS